jgi:hypothetical protein
MQRVVDAAVPSARSCRFSFSVRPLAHHGTRRVGAAGASEDMQHSGIHAGGPVDECRSKGDSATASG